MSQLISVIVPIYRVERTLDRCVRSILAQTYANFELLLVDDGSPDKCGELCDEWARKDSRIRVFHKANGGLSDARNYALDRIRGEYIAFVDSDDYVDERYLEYLIGLIRANPACRVAASGFWLVRGERMRKCGMSRGGIFPSRDVMERILYERGMTPSACAKLYHRSIFAKLRYRKGILFEDEDVIGQILLSTNAVAVGCESHYYYVQNSGSIVNQAFSLRKYNDQREAGERMCSLALEMDSKLNRAVKRRRARNCMSLLRLMGSVVDDYPNEFAALRREALRYAWTVMFDRKSGLRDKIGIITLACGAQVFFSSWAIYDRFRNRGKKHTKGKV